MANMVERVVAELSARLQAAGFHDIEITMKCNGDKLTIKPCGYGAIHSVGQIEYFLVESASLPYLGGDTLEIVARHIVEYPELLKQQEAYKLRLMEIADQLNCPVNMSADEWQARFDSFSDFYKDVYGHRPHGMRCQL